MIYKVLLFTCYCFYFVHTQENCVQPPLECPNGNVTFWLYTRMNPNNPHQLLVEDSKTLETGLWVEDAPIKVLIHGYAGSKDDSPNMEIRPAYYECCDYNIISVDYAPLAESPCYIQAARNTELVGKCTAQLIDELVTNSGFALLRFHIIGFSLGGQVAGFIPNYLTTGKLDRISALDAALPLFVTLDNDRKIDAGDAKLVDALHTNAFLFGKAETIGTVDFYANFGTQQPGCTGLEEPLFFKCSHFRAPAYYAESIVTDVGFYGYQCLTPISSVLIGCHKTTTLFGENIPLNASGLYFFKTNSEPPYARGLQGSNPLNII